MANHTKKVINMAMDVQKFTGAVVSIVVIVIIAIAGPYFRRQIPVYRRIAQARRREARDAEA